MKKFIKLVIILVLSVLFLVGCKKNGLVKIAKETYFYENGKKKVGWQEYHGDWFYFDNITGVARTGWYRDAKDGNWYYLDKEGRMKTNEFVEGNGKLYYVDANGKMLMSKDDNMKLVIIENKKYYVNKEGELLDEANYENMIKNYFAFKYKSKYATEYANYEYYIDKNLRDGKILDAKTKIEQYEKLVSKYHFDMVEKINRYNVSKYESINKDIIEARKFIKEYKNKLGY